MSNTHDDLAAFQQFAIQKLDAGETKNLEELFELWQTQQSRAGSQSPEQQSVGADGPFPNGVLKGTVNCKRDHYEFENPIEQQMYDDSLKWATQTIAAAIMIFNANVLQQPFDPQRWGLAVNEAHEIAHDIWESTDKDCGEEANFIVVFVNVAIRVFKWCFDHMNRRR